MLKITPEQLAILTREHMIGKVHAFLLEHSPDPALQALLASPVACRDFWLPHYDAIEGALGQIDEHALAVRLSYLLAARAHAMEPRLAYVEGEQGIVAMKSRLEERGVLAWGAFDS